MEAAARSRERMLVAAIVRSGADIASPIAGFVGVEVVELAFAASGQRPDITMMRVKAVVDVAVETMRAMEPRACAEKHPPNEPIWSIVAIRRTVIWGVVKVPVRANGRHSNTDGYLACCRRLRGAAEKRNCES